jgi:hypothetical protein
LKGVAQGGGAIFGVGLAKEGSGDSVRAGEAVGIVFFGGRGEGKFLAKSAFFEEAWFFEPMLLATQFPVVRVWRRVRLVHNIFLSRTIMWGRVGQRRSNPQKYGQADFVM